MIVKFWVKGSDGTPRIETGPGVERIFRRKSCLILKTSSGEISISPFDLVEVLPAEDEESPDGR